MSDTLCTVISGRKGYRNGTVKQRLFRKLILDTSGCWLWTGSKDRKGYGQIRVNGRGLVYTHRLSWEIYNGPIDEGMEIDHRVCSREACANPEHLKPKTRAGNSQHRRGARFDSRSGVRGVSYDSRPQPLSKRWMATVNANGRQVLRKRFATIEEAEAAAIAARAQHHEE